MELPALISPFLIGASIIVILFPKSKLQGVWLVLTISLGAGLGLGITSSMIFMWLAIIGRPGSYYFAAELSLAVILAIFCFLPHSSFNIQYSKKFSIMSTIILFSLKDRYPEISFPLLFLAGLTVSCAAWTKNEGQLFLVLVIFVYLLGQLRKQEWSKTLKEFICFTLGLAPVLGTLFYFKINFALENAHLNDSTLKQLGTYLTDINRYILVGSIWVDKFLTFNDGIVWLMAGYFFFSGLDRPDLIKKRLLAPAILLLLLMCGYFFVYITYPGNPRDLLSASLRRIIIQLWPTWVFLFFYCVQGPEKNVSIPANSPRSF